MSDKQLDKHVNELVASARAWGYSHSQYIENPHDPKNKRKMNRDSRDTEKAKNALKDYVASLSSKESKDEKKAKREEMLVANDERPIIKRRVFDSLTKHNDVRRDEMAREFRIVE